jgi:hypothetical protein
LDDLRFERCVALYRHVDVRDRKMFAITNFSRLIMACLQRIGTEVSGPLDGKTLLGDLVLDPYCASHPTM